MVELYHIIYTHKQVVRNTLLWADNKVQWLKLVFATLTSHKECCLEAHGSSEPTSIQCTCKQTEVMQLLESL